MITPLASGGICWITDELKGTQPLKTAAPPRVLGYSRVLAKVNAPEKSISEVKVKNQ